MQKEKLLSVINLNKYFVKSGKLIKVLDDISFDVYKNDFFGIIGESGSGKSTTGKCIIRLYNSSSGIIEFDNKIINQKLTKNDKKQLYKNMSMVFQDPMSSLNPKKTILSIIAEPLYINKVIKNDAKKVIHTCLSINSYFKLTYQIQDYELTKTYLETFYLKAIEVFKKYIDIISNFEINQNNDQKALILNYLSILSELEMEYKLLIPNIYTYNREIANLLWVNDIKLKNKELNKQEQDYYHTKQLYDDNKPLLNHSKEYLELTQTKKELESSLQTMIDSIQQNYCVQNKDFLTSLINNLKSEIKINKQNKQLSSSITQYNILKLKIMIAIEMLTVIDSIKNETFYLKQDLDEFLEYLFTIVKQKYNYVFGDILLLSQLSNQIDNLSIEANQKDEILKIMDEYNQQYKKIINEINELADAPKVVDDPKVIEIKDKFIKQAQKINLNKEQIINFYHRTIKKINDKLTKLDSQYKHSQEFIQNKQNIDILKDELAVYSQARNDLIKNETSIFQKQSIPLIKEQKQIINELKKQLFTLQKEYKKIVLVKSKQINEFYKQQDHKDYKYWKDFLNKETKAKFINIQAINFELFTYLDEIDIYRQLRSTSRLKLLFLTKSLKQIITRKYVYNALNEVGLKNEHAYRYPHEFSGGQRQRVVIARALIMKPKLVIADEPISALDVSIQAQVVNIMKNLSEQQGITFLFIAHDLSMVHHISNRLIIMHKGRIVEKGDTNAIFANPIHPYTKSLIKASPELSKIHVDLASFNTDLDYDKNYENNQETLKFYSVSESKEHFVFATMEQFKKWTNQKN